MDGLQKILRGMGDERAYENQWITTRAIMLFSTNIEFDLSQIEPFSTLQKKWHLQPKLQLCFIGQRVHLSDLQWIFLTLSTVYVWCYSEKKRENRLFLIVHRLWTKIEFLPFDFSIADFLPHFTTCRNDAQYWIMSFFLPYRKCFFFLRKKKLCSKNKIPFGWLFAQLFHCEGSLYFVSEVCVQTENQIAVIQW